MQTKCYHLLRYPVSTARPLPVLIAQPSALTMSLPLLKLLTPAHPAALSLDQPACPVLRTNAQGVPTVQVQSSLLTAGVVLLKVVSMLTV